MSEELKPCPFCGSDKVCVEENDWGWMVMFCRTCRCNGPEAATREEAIAKANERAEQ